MRRQFHQALIAYVGNSPSMLCGFRLAQEVGLPWSAIGWVDVTCLVSSGYGLKWLWIEVVGVGCQAAECIVVRGWGITTPLWAIALTIWQGLHQGNMGCRSKLGERDSSGASAHPIMVVALAAWHSFGLILPIAC